MDDYFMHVKSVVNAQATLKESVTCIAVQEDRHQNMISSVVLQKGVEEQWTIKKVATIIDLLGS